MSPLLLRAHPRARLSIAWNVVLMLSDACLHGNRVPFRDGTASAVIHSSVPDAKRLIPRYREHDFIRQSGAETESVHWQGRKTPTDKPRAVTSKRAFVQVTKAVTSNQIDHDSGQKALSFVCVRDLALTCVLFHTKKVFLCK